MSVRIVSEAEGAAGQAAGALRTEAASADDLRRLAGAGRLWALLDACDAPAVPEKVGDLGEERAVSLYRGGAEEDWWAIAPYLARADGSLIDWIAETLEAESWGVFVVADADLEGLRRHFRRFLIVEDPDGEEMYFRFYDPRVLAKFLPTCSSFELREIFGPVEAFGVPGEEEGACRLLRPRNARPPAVIYRPGKNQHFRIRQAQMEVFQPEAEAAFEARLADYLYGQHFEAVRDLSDDLLKERIHNGIARARGYGLSWQSSLTVFVALMFEIAPNFDSHPYIRRVLTDPRVPPDERMDRLMEWTGERTWEEAEARYDAAAWSTRPKGNV
jgi:hypothetical protein